jgi:hypothetical protein
VVRRNTPAEAANPAAQPNVELQPTRKIAVDAIALKRYPWTPTLSVGWAKRFVRIIGPFTLFELLEGLSRRSRRKLRLSKRTNELFFSITLKVYLQPFSDDGILKISMGKKGMRFYVLFRD